jgi:uncharacterized glyoxalase superfamily protein PhnB
MAHLLEQLGHWSKASCSCIIPHAIGDFIEIIAKRTAIFAKTQETTHKPLRVVSCLLLVRPEKEILMKAIALKCKQSVPVIASADVRKTIDYYANVLGFQEHFVYGDPPVYAGIKRDDALLYIGHDPILVQQLKDGCHNPDVFLWVEGVDELYQEHKAKGAKIVEEIADRPWDARQYVVEDPSGYYLKIAQPINSID